MILSYLIYLISMPVSINNTGFSSTQFCPSQEASPKALFNLTNASLPSNTSSPMSTTVKCKSLDVGDQKVAQTDEPWVT